MATRKATRSHSKTKAARQVRTFPQTKGKTIESIELSTASDEFAIDIRFHDKTTLTFDLESSVSVMPELVDWKTGKYRPLKRWRPMHK
jgi:hypothetical protein